MLHEYNNLAKIHFGLFHDSLSDAQQSTVLTVAHKHASHHLNSLHTVCVAFIRLNV